MMDRTSKTERTLTKLEVAQVLMDCGCLKLSVEKPFTYASGLQGPVYCDNRLILSFPRERTKLMHELSALIKEKSDQSDAVVGVATAGIPHGALVAHLLDRPFLYVRSDKKSHGRQNQVEGHFVAGQEVVMVEDLVNQGGSLAQAVEGVRSSGLRVEQCFCLVDYQMQAAQSVLANHAVKLHSLTDFDSILEAATARKMIESDQGEELRRWQKDPKNWS